MLERMRLEAKARDLETQKTQKACDHANFERDLLAQQLEEVVRDYV